MLREGVSIFVHAALVISKGSDACAGQNVRELSKKVSLQIRGLVAVAVCRAASLDKQNGRSETILNGEPGQVVKGILA